MKDKLVNALGWFGYIIYFLIVSILAFIPLSILQFSFWINILIIPVILFIPFWGDIAEFLLWAISFPKAISGEQDVWAIIYYIGLVVYAITSLLPTVINWIILLIEKIRKPPLVPREQIARLIHYNNIVSAEEETVEVEEGNKFPSYSDDKIAKASYYMHMDLLDAELVEEAEKAGMFPAQYKEFCRLVVEGHNLAKNNSGGSD